MEQKDDNLNREVVQKKNCNLQNIIDTLRPAFELLSAIDGKSLILTMGVTGCGKSTMLNSLIYGPKQMHKTKITESIEKSDGTVREVSKNVMEMMNKTEGFKIGHSLASSQTFIPEFLKDPDANRNLVWADLAGFQDTTELIEFINQFINKKIFLIAKEVKFIVPFTIGSCNDGRGGQIMPILKLIQNICSEVLDSENFQIQTVLTQVDPNDDEFDKDVVIGNLQECVDNEVNKQFKHLEDFDETNVDEDKQYVLQQRETIQNFYNLFPDNLQVYDPLDRDIMTDGESISIKRDELIEKIYNLSSQSSDMLNIPLDNWKYKKLTEMINDEKQKCQDMADEQLRTARKEGQSFQEQLSGSQEVQSLKTNLQFLIDHKLLADATQMLGDFNSYLDSIQEQTTMAKIYGEASNVLKLSFEYSADIIQRKGDKKYDQLVKKMIQLHEQIEKLESYKDIKDQAQQKEVTATLASMKELIKKTPIDVCKDHHDTICFCYQIRKMDITKEQETKEKKEGYYTNLFLKDVEIDELLMNIIESNNWNGTKMEINQNTFFRLQIGDNYKYEMRSKISQEKREVPFIISPKTSADVQNQRTSDSGFVKFMEGLQLAFEKIPQMIQERWGAGDQRIQFLLTHRGIEIIQGDKKLLTTGGPVEQGQTQPIVFGDDSLSNFSEERCTNYTIVPFSKLNKNSKYYVQMPYGEVKPRLKPVTITPGLWSKLIATTRKKDGHSNKDAAVWRILPAS